MKTLSMHALRILLVLIVVATLGITLVQPEKAVQAGGTCWCTGVTAAVKGLPSDFPDGWAWDDPSSRYGGTSYLAKNGYVRVTGTPQAGDIVVFNNINHVGVLDKYNSNGSFTLIQNIGNPTNNPPDTAKNSAYVVDHTYYAVGNCTNVGRVIWGTGNSVNYYRKNAPVSQPTVFVNGYSKPWQDQNWGRLNLTVSANNLNGQNICVHTWRAGRDFGITCKRATASSITFYDLDGAGPMNSRTTYYTQVAMNQNPKSSWPAPNCAAATGGQGLCDALYRP
jgi:hypothetical protein